MKLIMRQLSATLSGWGAYGSLQELPISCQIWKFWKVFIAAIWIIYHNNLLLLEVIKKINWQHCFQ